MSGKTLDLLTHKKSLYWRFWLQNFCKLTFKPKATFKFDGQTMSRLLYLEISYFFY